MNSAREGRPPALPGGLIVFTLWLLVFSSASQTMIISPILPRIGDELGIPDAALGTLVSAYTLMVGIFAILAGPVSDKVGRRRILMLGTGTMTVALVLHALVTNYAAFLARARLRGDGGWHAQRGRRELHRRLLPLPPAGMGHGLGHERGGGGADRGHPPGDRALEPLGVPRALPDLRGHHGRHRGAALPARAPARRAREATAR